MNDFFDRHPRFFETSGVGTWPQRLALRYEAIIEANRDLFANASVLDLASHNGRWSYAALCAGAAHVTGIEARPELIAVANENMRYYGISEDRYRFIQGDLNKLTYSDETYDVVLCLGYFYHTLNHLRLLDYIQSTRARRVILDGMVTPGTDPTITVYAEHVAQQANGWADTGLRDSQLLVGHPSVPVLGMMLDHIGYDAAFHDWQDMLRRQNVTFDLDRGNDADNPVGDYAQGARATAVAVRRPDPSSNPSSSARPNILFVVADDLNSWIGALGRHPDVKTPNIDALAARGTLFTNAYCSAPYCNASRMGIFTGCLPSTTGIYHDEPFWDRADRRQTFIERLREAGYYTTGAGKVFHGVFDYAAAGQNGSDHAKWREIENRGELWDRFLTNDTEPLPADRPLNRLFDFGDFSSVPPMYHHFDWGPLPEDRVDGIPDEKVVRSVQEFLSSSPPEPFFCAAGLYKPHLPWHVPARFFDLYDPDSITLPVVRADDLDDVPPIGREWALSPRDHELVTSAGQWRAAVRGYLAAISYCDHLVGEIVSALESAGLADRTIIVFCGDNGFHLGEKLHWRKFALWEEATRVPLIISAPASSGGVKRVYQPVSLIDVYPTLMDLCGLDCPPVDGTNLTPLLSEGENSGVRPAALMTWGEGNHSVRTAEWRLIRYRDGTEELYDHRVDPFEWRNLATTAGFETVLEELRQKLPGEPRKASPGRGRGPDFLGIGAQKAGTTWLFENLKRHPDIGFPAEKEVHFWDRREDRPVSEWLDLFPADKPGKQGEITPSYGFLDIEIIREIEEHCPELKLFYSIRNPIARAWSSALMALERAEMTLDEASDLWFIEHFRSAGSRQRGDAEACLARWRSVFPAEQIHVLLFDDLVESPLETLIKVADHIGADGEFFRSVPEEELKKPVFAGPGDPLRPELRRFLKIQYGYKIARLQDMLGRDLSHWLSD